MLGQIEQGIHYGIVLARKGLVWWILSCGGALQFRQNLLAVKLNHAALIVLPSVNIDHGRAALE
ncbi:MAG: hypothetical protein JWO71_3654 [Candidatus Acidoferrum typicum]|nr:hypothetical protein [Candidatus Acidoferrum typicum]